MANGTDKAAGLPKWHPAFLIATGGGLGLLPRAPGTWGSLGALPLALGIYYAGGPLIVLAAVVVAFCVGCWAANVYISHTRAEDPPEVVIDEIAAQMAIFVFVPPTWYNLLLGFVLFRIADIWKPWPVRVADRSIGGGFGAMFDDLLAATYAGGLLWLINLVISLKDMSMAP
ncbi:MAG TPA: phosphatidylglycerophosphatase A [Alphaproteobacteria bacterium]|jgi:phosphatidylglycerophosphatase A